MAIKALIFDLDNTLINRNESIKPMHEWLVQTFLHDFSLQKQHEALVLLKQWDYYGYVSHETVLRCFSKTYGLDFDIKEVTHTIRTHQGYHAKPLDGALETLEILHKDYILALLTNGSSIGQRLKIDTALTSHQKLFTEILISGDKGVHKPNPQVYEALMKSLNLTPQECVYIGDDLTNDIIAPMKLGMKAIRMNHCNLETTSLTVEINHISALLDLDFDAL
ncbi:hypothetical protein AOC36_10790 [Erysipelothrix larvae]|uniref:Haloacid dehalogenase n=1 Tax=Erysipelothrix larvae TaxID=1514105 RepID=A0A109UHM3_9FIRM|nr:HAD family hydrolase [Erysipelothrix larvae]AMC94440.1 hypothetical protein AOC36_10790 [Erysipelothrix larvae]